MKPGARLVELWDVLDAKEGKFRNSEKEAGIFFHGSHYSEKN